jgi:hypothetical protein
MFDYLMRLISAPVALFTYSPVRRRVSFRPSYVIATRCGRAGLPAPVQRWFSLEQIAASDFARDGAAEGQSSHAQEEAFRCVLRRCVPHFSRGSCTAGVFSRSLRAVYG